MKDRLLLTMVIFVLAVNSCKKDSPDNPATQTPSPVPTAIGTPIGLPVSTSVDASGGTITSPDGYFELIIPAGALTSSVIISIQPITNECHGAASDKAYRLTPDGLQFAIPVTLRFHPTPGMLAGTDLRALGIAFQRSDNTWLSYETLQVDTVNQIVETQTSHFTDEALYTNWRLTPSYKEINVNETTTVEVYHIQQRSFDGGGESLAELIGTFHSADANNGQSQISNWKLNGSVNPPASHGELIGLGHVGSYEAPSSEPPVNPAAVSVEINVPGRPVMYLVSNIMVNNTHHYKLTLSVSFFSGGIGYCMITNYSDTSSLFFHVDSLGTVVTDNQHNYAPFILFTNLPGCNCSSVYDPIGLAHIDYLTGTSDGSYFDLQLGVLVGSPGTTGDCGGSPLNLNPSTSSQTYFITQFDISSPVQSTPYGNTLVTLYKID